MQKRRYDTAYSCMHACKRNAPALYILVVCSHFYCQYLTCLLLDSCNVVEGMGMFDNPSNYMMIEIGGVNSRVCCRFNCCLMAKVVNIRTSCAAMDAVCMSYVRGSDFEKSEIFLNRLVGILEREKMTERIMYADGEQPCT